MSPPNSPVLGKLTDKGIYITGIRGVIIGKGTRVLIGGLSARWSYPENRSFCTDISCERTTIYNPEKISVRIKKDDGTPDIKVIDNLECIPKDTELTMSAFITNHYYGTSIARDIVIEDLN